ncbi:hypothetical protein QYF36_009598 [Acer negundo]|nr:hypothetical protein QYF36_009598 [Acer negundo]
MEGESGGQAKATPSIVLAEISNKRAFRKSQSSCPSSSKYQLEDIEDFEVLRSLHNHPLPVKVDSISALNGEDEKSLNTVDVVGNSNFDVVASKLREAMKVAME